MRKSIYFAGVASLQAITLPAVAQDTATGVSAMSDSDVIIVTARRTEENLQDVPISITVLSDEAIAKRNVFNAGDLGAYVPSLSTNANFGPEKSSFSIRGFIQEGRTSPSVGVYFADVVAPRANTGTTSGNGAGVGAFFDLQNVQVLKGPQGTLFGRNTTGGAILLVPNKPTNDLEGYVEGSLGDYDMRRVQAVLNVPLADTFKVRLGVDRMKRDGYLVNRSGIGPNRMANTDYIAARLSVVADLTPNLENYTIATYADSDTNGTTFRVVTCKRPDAGLPNNGYSGLQFYGGTFGCAQVDRQNARGDGWWDVENSHPSPRVRNESWQVINTTTWQASDSLTIKNIVSYSELREDALLNLGGDNFVGLAPVILINSTKGYHYGGESTLTEELQFQGRHGRLTWQAGGYLEVSNPLGTSSQSVPLLLNCPDPSVLQCEQGISFSPTIHISNFTRAFYKKWWRSKGLYAQGTYELTDQLSMTGGLRYTWDSQRHYQSNSAVRFLEDNVPTAFCSDPIRNPGPAGPGSTRNLDDPDDYHQCDLEFRSKSSKPTWVIDLDYKPTPDIMLFAKWSRGYRAGGVNTPYVFFETWGPEKVDTYELGAKTSFRGAVSGYLNVTGFYNDFRDQQIQANLNAKVGAPLTGGTATINAGKSRIWGVEVDTSVTLFDSLNIQAGYTYLNTKILELTNIPPDEDIPWVPGESPWRSLRPTAVEGLPLALSPKHRVQVTGTYTLPLDESIGRISLGATYVHTAKQIANPNVGTEFGFLPASDLLNLNANWKDVAGMPVDLAFFMTNVTNEKLALNVGNFYNSFGYEAVPVNEPRMWGFRLKYRFGT